jgi:hypothetical protein
MFTVGLLEAMRGRHLELEFPSDKDALTSEAGVALSLVLYCGEADPATISTILGVAPSWSRTFGSVYGKVRPLAAKKSVWCFEAPNSDQTSFRAQLTFLVGTMSANLSTIQERMGVEVSGQISCHCTVADPGMRIALDPEQIDSIAKTNLDLWFDVYA